jgi:hypothetical protein
MKAFAFILLLCFWNIAYSEQLPSKIQLDYTLSNGAVSLPVTEILESSQNKYSIASEARATGIVALFFKGRYERKSQGIITGRGLRPNEFSLQKGKVSQTAIFDWSKKTLALDHDGTKDTVALPENAYDVLSFPYNFVFRSMSENELNFFMTDGRKLNSYRYVVAGKTTLNTSLGELKTIHLVKQHEKDDPGTEIWLAIDHHFLPVRVLVIDEDGSKLDQVISKISYP